MNSEEIEVILEAVTSTLETQQALMTTLKKQIEKKETNVPAIWLARREENEVDSGDLEHVYFVNTDSADFAVDPGMIQDVDREKGSLNCFESEGAAEYARRVIIGAFDLLKDKPATGKAQEILDKLFDRGVLSIQEYGIS